MNIHEYQAKGIFREYGIPVPKGIPAFTVEEAEKAATSLISETGSEVVVVKAQIHAGGRGKAGGVKVVKGAAGRGGRGRRSSSASVARHPPDGPRAGKKVQRLYVEQGLAIKPPSSTLALVIDRETHRVAIMASLEGGVDIEEVAETHPGEDPQDLDRPGGGPSCPTRFASSPSASA